MVKTVILLATYNSSRYLREQIDSLLCQTEKNWTLYIHDDGSSDNTLDIIGEYVHNYPNKIYILANDKTGLGAYMSFVTLMNSIDADYYMFCDHDDVWLPYKVETTVNEMRYLESRSPHVPVIVHSDMKVVDQNLNVLSESFWQYSRFLPDHCSFIDLACCNCVNGCTMLINKKAKEVALPNVPHCLMHDALVAQSVAACGGIIYAIKQPLVLYRQHVDNVIGAPDVKKAYFYERLKHLISAIRDNIDVWKRARQIQKISLFEFLAHKFYISKHRYQLS